MSARRKNKDKDKDKGTDKATTRCEWDEDADRILVTKLRECKELGMQSDSGWKPQLKAGLKSVRAVRGASGFGWDNERKMPTATGAVWDAYIAKHKGAAKWRSTPFPLYDEILELVDGTIATGAGAFHPALGTQDSDADGEDEQSQTQTQTQNFVTPPRRSPRRPAASTPGDLQSSSPIQPNRRKGPKRAASGSPERSTTRKTRKRNSEVISGVAEALDRVAASLQVVGSPEVCKKAIQLMEDDGDFSENEGANIMMLFVEKTAYASAYLAARNKERRTAFLTRLLRVDDNTQ
ncbi:hypothetical protein B0H16DRAFT_1467373 [Mycena metata]|uniref:Myb/SANT-like domain-containing protein n=1 Tax=Mycena metata TaxID=1033252 RepID=A0AAD7I628_9AGAR|nr:hypothetical protein B0H16DRAFT_1467373 [Mycena metata]